MRGENAELLSSSSNGGKSFRANTDISQGKRRGKHSHERTGRMATGQMHRCPAPHGAKGWSEGG